MTFQGHFPAELTWGILKLSTFIIFTDERGCRRCSFRKECEAIKGKTLTLAHLASSATSLPFRYSLTVPYLSFWPPNPIMQLSAWPVVVIPYGGVDSSSLTAQIPLHFHQDVRSEVFTVTYNPPPFIHVTNPLKQSPDTAGAFFKRFCPDGVWGTIPFISLLLPPILYPSSAPTAACPT